MSYSTIAIAMLVFGLIIAVYMLYVMLKAEEKAHGITRARYAEDHQRRHRKDRAVNFTNRIFNALNAFIKDEPLPLRITRENDIITVTRHGKKLYECFVRAEPTCVVCVTLNIGGATYEHEATDEFIIWLIEGAKETLRASCKTLVA